MDPAFPVPSTPGPAPIWGRRVSRRALLATGAAGATGTAVAVLWGGGELGRVLEQVRGLTHGYQGPLTGERVRVAHLLRRAGFGASPQELDRYATLGSVQTTKSLLNYQNTPNQALDNQLAGFDPSQLGQGTRGTLSLQSWWLQRMVATARPLEEKMTLFWHGLLTSGLDKAGGAQLYQQNQLFRQMALGNFDEMLKAVSKDPAMMIYLDTETNRVGKPNENYARELMELFTTGIGHYQESDVRESARAFTGWALTGGRLRLATDSIFVPRRHDSGRKTFLGKSGLFTGDDIVEMLVPLRATAERLSTKLFSFFAYNSPEPEIVAHLADVFQHSRYNVGAVVKEIFSMDAFYSPKAYRALIKSPAEFVAQAMRSTGAGTSDARVAVGTMSQMGQVLFYPPNVAGWPGGTSWINSATLLARTNFGNTLAAKVGPSWSGKTPDQMAAALLDNNLTPSTQTALREYAVLHPGDAASLLFFTLATPEYQLN